MCKRNNVSAKCTIHFETSHRTHSYILHINLQCITSIDESKYHLYTLNNNPPQCLSKFYFRPFVCQASIQPINSLFFLYFFIINLLIFNVVINKSINTKISKKFISIFQPIETEVDCFIYHCFPFFFPTRINFVYSSVGKKNNSF